MRTVRLAVLIVFGTALASLPLFARGGGGRGGGGGGRGGGGGFSGGGARGGGFSGGGGYGGGGGAMRPSTGNVGAANRGGYSGGGYGAAAPRAANAPDVNRGSGSYTTKGGSTINYGGAGVSGTTKGGVDYGRAVGGATVTGPGGNTVSKAGGVGGVSGPGGNSAVRGGGVTTGTGANGGSFSSAYKGGVAIGPGGAAATGGRVSAGTGAGGNSFKSAAAGAAAGGAYGAVARGGRAGAAAGPGGNAAWGSRGVAGRGAYGTAYASRSVMASTGAGVRSNFRYGSAFRPGWFPQYPGAWALAGWTASAIWNGCSWGACADWGGYPAEPSYYDYGDNVVYQDDSVYIDGNDAYPAEQFDQQAVDLATAGKAAMTGDKPEEWQSLGVFAMVGEGETTSTNIFQIAVNKAGVLRGNYYNATADTTEPIFGSVGKETQRAAWTVADRKNPVYDVGIANLTLDETTMLVHYEGKGNAKQFMLVRIPPPPEEPAPTTGEAPGG